MLEGLVLESFTRMNQRRPPQSTQFSAKAAIQTASMMFSILRRKVARPLMGSVKMVLESLEARVRNCVIRI